MDIFKLKAFRSDNGIYKAAEFRAEIHDNDQHITYYGVGAHHQNGVAEIYIRTMVEKMRTVLPNAYARWPSPISMEYWTFSFRHFVNQRNSTPRFGAVHIRSDEKYNRLKRQNRTAAHLTIISIPLDV